VVRDQAACGCPAFWDSARILRRRSADAVLGMGGYVCFTGGMMAALLGKPLMLVNADASLLLSNKALLPVADGVAFGFDGPAVARVRHGVVTGNPVRHEIEALPAPEDRFAGRAGPLQVLVVGGSLGARVLNETLPAALAQIAPDKRPQVTHQTGTAHLDDVAALCHAGCAGRDPAFVDDMAARGGLRSGGLPGRCDHQSASSAWPACPACWCLWW
jgi:UDP-N-acetylglucosamine--N-acetylmuramyl-(pentapeptide) pyrophosphoryl-undecaprenol N-acetylglucosamine transferase